MQTSNSTTFLGIMISVMQVSIPVIQRYVELPPPNDFIVFVISKNGLLLIVQFRVQTGDILISILKKSWIPSRKQSGGFIINLRSLDSLRLFNF